jgi:hypothetical protein
MLRRSNDIYPGRIAPPFYALILSRHDHRAGNNVLASFKWCKELLVETLWSILEVVTLGGTTDTTSNRTRLRLPA